MKATKTKRLLAACLALMLTIGLLATGVFAAKNTSVSDVKEKTGSNGQIVVTVYDQTPGAAGTGAQVSSGLGNPVDGVGINALRIGSVVELTTSTTDDATEPNTTTVKTQVAFGLTQEMAKLVGLNPLNNTTEYIVYDQQEQIYYYSPKVVQDALSGKNDAEGGQDAIEAYLNAVENGATKQVTDSDGVATFNDLSYGLYLLAKSKLPDNATTDLVPFLVSVPMYVEATAGATGTWNNIVYAYPKVRTGNVTIEKAVNETDKYVNAGQTLEYTLTATIQEAQTGNAAATPFTSFVITDTNLDKTLNLVFPDGTIPTTVELGADNVLKGISKAEYNGLDQGNKATYHYYYEYTDIEADTSPDSHATSVLTITLTPAGLDELNENLTTEQTITVTYKATVATDVNFSTKLTNTATASYQRDGMEGPALASVAEGESNIVDLYTYGLDLKKILSDNGPITVHTISFELYKKYEAGAFSEKVPVLAGTGSNGGYWVAANEGDPNVTMFVGANGKLNLYGLEPGTYYLKELTTQSGYTLLAEPIKIEITAPETAGNPAIAKVNGATAQVENGVVYLQVENTKNEDGFNLPQTGGAGTLLATAIGLGLLCAGVVLLVAYRKKSHS